MTDALCGPSNALSSFQKHTQVDRTLQQDRLTGPRQSPAQGFRSFDPRIGSLDADFHAFENAPTDPFQLDQSAWQQHGMPVLPPQPSSGWASDFQSLRISNSPIPVSQFRTEAPLVRTAPGGWQQEFMSQRQNLTPVAQHKQPELAHPTHQYQPSSLQGQSLTYAPSMYAQLNATNQVDASAKRFDEADFEKAFQEAFDHIQMSDPQGVIETPHLEEISNAEVAAEQMIHESSAARIGSDAINYREAGDRTSDQDTRDAGELAKVAGQLVQNVSHETSEKFRNSQFLDLMRRIRDREIEVRNNDFEPIAETYATQQFEPVQTRTEDQHTFQFPNMDEVYYPDSNLDMTLDDSFVYNPVPRTQISDLHPGGPLYPEQSPPHPRYAHMSGAVASAASTGDAASGYAQA